MTDRGTPHRLIAALRELLRTSDIVAFDDCAEGDEYIKARTEATNALGDVEEFAASAGTDDPIANKLPLQDEIEAVLFSRALRHELEGFTAITAHEIAEVVAAHVPPQYPIELNAEQEKCVAIWAADDRCWTTQETVAFNLRTFARKILGEVDAARASCLNCQQSALSHLCPPEFQSKIAGKVTSYLASAQRGWIPVSERLPEFAGTYLVAVNGPGDDGESYVGSLPADWSMDDKYWHDLRGWGSNEVTHWMPLPAPPAESAATKEK